VGGGAGAGNPRAGRFRRSLPGDAGSLDFSFSGLKTAVLYHLRGQDSARGAAPVESAASRVADVAASFQEAVVDVLVARAVQAAEATRRASPALGGRGAC